MNGNGDGFEPTEAEWDARLDEIDGEVRDELGRISGSEGEINYQDDTLIADSKAFLLKLRDAVSTIASEETFLGHVRRLQAAATAGNVVDAISEPVHEEHVKEVVAKKFGFDESEKRTFLRNLIRGDEHIPGGSTSPWAIANAVTATANDAESYDRAVELEEAGNSVIELPRSFWKTELQAVA